MTAQHNIEYGFYRNLLGIKYIGIIIVLISIVFSIVVFIRFCCKEKKDR